MPLRAYRGNHPRLSNKPLWFDTVTSTVKTRFLLVRIWGNAGHPALITFGIILQANGELLSQMQVVP